MADTPDLKSVATIVASEFDSRLPEFLLLRIINKIKFENECWLWQGAITKSTGYGKIKWQGKAVDIHRLIGKYLFGELVTKDEICHVRECPNRHCIRPSHLYKGDKSQNMVDAFMNGKLKIGGRIV